MSDNDVTLAWRGDDMQPARTGTAFGISDLGFRYTSRWTIKQTAQYSHTLPSPPESNQTLTNHKKGIFSSAKLTTISANNPPCFPRWVGGLFGGFVGSAHSSSGLGLERDREGAGELAATHEIILRGGEMDR